jgi:hypothetical protein
MAIRLRHLWLLLTRLPGILLRRENRTLYLEARALLETLPQEMKRPLPEWLADLTPERPDRLPPTPIENNLRQIADIAALLDRRSPLGLCLRRSLLRYHFLRRAGLPVVVRFGARFQKGVPDRAVTGHAWTTLDGKPYYEDDENWRGFSEMLSFPPGAN